MKYCIFQELSNEILLDLVAIIGNKLASIQYSRLGLEVKTFEPHNSVTGGQGALKFWEKYSFMKVLKLTKFHQDPSKSLPGGG